MENIDSYVATVDELVDDENKIVTYKFLSQQLALPVSKAKKILDIYVKNSDSRKISVVYSLTGRVNHGLCVSVVRDVELEVAKSRFNLVLGCHPYSVQKAKLTDSAPIYNADYDMTKKILYHCASFGEIRFNGAKLLSEADLKKFRSCCTKASNKDIKAPETKEKAYKKPVQEKKSSTFFGSNSVKKDVTKKTNVDSAPASNGKTDNNETAQTKQAAEHERKNSDQIVTNITSQNKLKQGKKMAGMSAFMTKGKSDLFKNSKPVAKIETTKSDLSNVNNERASGDDELSDAMEVQCSDIKVEEEIIPKNKIPETVAKKVEENLKKKTPPKKSYSGKKPRSNSSELPAKKRRKIQQFLSSSSESDNEEEQFDDIIPPSPTPPPVIKGKKLGSKNPRKKMVMKSHTYSDKDGSMLTEKAYEEVSCSSGDDSDVIKQKVKETTTPPGDKMKPTFEKKPVIKGKQSSLMGYFGKKT